MNCFPCFQNKQESKSEEEKKDLPIAQPKEIPPTTTPPPPVNNNHGADDQLDNVRNAAESEDSTVRSFTFRELATATKNFRQETLLGEGGFGKVFKGTLSGSGKIVAVRQLDRNGTQGGKDFVFEVSNLSLLHHPNIVKMVGYCADGEQRLLVYEYLPSGSLDTHLFDLPAGKSPMDWTSRMKVALGIAEGLEYLHEKANPPIIYRDLKSSNVLLNESKSPKLTDCGLANIVQSGQKMHVSVMAGYNGYCAPEYERNGDLTIKSDVYSFGVVLLELITGRRALDTTKPAEEQSLVSWAQPIFKDPSRFPDMADPLLRKGFAVTSLNQAVGVAAMCLQEEPSARPFISDISAALSFLAMAPPEAPIPDRLVPILSRAPTARQGENSNSNNNNNNNSNSNNSAGDLKQDDDEDDATSVSEDEDDDQTRASDQDDDDDDDDEDGNSSSEYEYGDSSDGSDYEDMSKIESRKEPSPDSARCKSTKSKKLGSSSKRKSKKQSIEVPSRSRHSKKVVIPPTKPGPINTQQSRDGSDNSSSSDEECWNDSQDTRSYGINSRSESTKDDYGSYSSSSEEDN